MAVIEREGRYLISRRRPDDSYGGLWEFPGGSRCPDETLEHCLVREIREELGLEIAVRQKLRVIRHHTPGRAIRLHCFACRVVSGEPKAIDCSDWRWVGSEELARYPFPPASGPLIELLTRGPCGGR